LNKENICNKCVKRCFYCGEEFGPEFIILDPLNGRDTCRRCKAKDVKREILKDLD
jgi:hypothetical protein